MLARCTHCESTFVTQQFGRQRCPKCNAEVVIDDPRPPPTDGSPLPQMSEAPEVDPTAPTPWERRGEIGLWRGLTETAGETLARPTAFFTRMRYDSDKGAALYAFIFFAIPAMVFTAIDWLSYDAEGQRAQLDTAKAQMKDVMHQFPQGGGGFVEALRKAATDQMEKGLPPHTVGGLVSNAVAAAGFALFYLVVSAAIAHLVLTALGGANGGWTATFKVFCYSTTPGIFFALPLCYGILGGLIGFTWAAAIQIIGLPKAHKTTIGKATMAVIGWELLLFTCCCGLAFVVVSAALKGAGGE